MTEQIIHIVPAMPCHECTRRTHTAMLSDLMQPNFQPLCYEHGFVDFPGQAPTKAEIPATYASVERYVLGYYDGIGACTVIGLVPLAQVPGYQRTELEIRDPRGDLLPPEHVETMRFPDKAFYCQYRDGQQSTHVYAIWDYATLAFRMIEESPLEQPSV